MVNPDEIAMVLANIVAQVKGKEFVIDVEIPVNCHATLYMPEKFTGKVIELESGKHKRKKSVIGISPLEG